MDELVRFRLQYWLIFLHTKNCFAQKNTFFFLLKNIQIDHFLCQQFKTYSKQNIFFFFILFSVKQKSHTNQLYKKFKTSIYIMKFIDPTIPKIIHTNTHKNRKFLLLLNGRKTNNTKKHKALRCANFQL